MCLINPSDRVTYVAVAQTSSHNSAVIALSWIEHIKPQPAMCFDSGRFLLAASRSMCFSMTSQVAKSISFALALRCLPSITRRFLRSCAICFCRRYSGDCRGYLRCCRLRLVIMRISLLCGARFCVNPSLFLARVIV